MIDLSGIFSFIQGIQDFLAKIAVALQPVLNILRFLLFDIVGLFICCGLALWILMIAGILYLVELRPNPIRRIRSARLGKKLAEVVVLEVFWLSKNFGVEPPGIKFTFLDGSYAAYRSSNIYIDIKRVAVRSKSYREIVKLLRYIVAHEFAHYLQDLRSKNPQSKNPRGRRRESPFSEDEAYEFAQQQSGLYFGSFAKIMMRGEVHKLDTVALEKAACKHVNKILKRMAEPGFFEKLLAKHI